MNLHAHFSKSSLDFISGFWKFLQELSRHIKECLLWPSSEPIEGTAVNQGWELTASHSQGFSDWGHAQADMEVLSHSADEKSSDVVKRVHDLLLIANWSKSIVDFLLVFWKHEIWNFSCVKKIVEVLNEALTDDLSISHDERDSISLNT